MKYIAKQLMMTALLLMTATTLWAAGSVTVVKKLNGTANSSAGNVEYSITNGICTLTVTPASGNYITVANITAERTVSGGIAQSPRRAPNMDNGISVSATNASADPSGITTYTLVMPDAEYDVEVVADFQSRKDISGGTLVLTPTTYTYKSEEKKPAVTLTLSGSTISSDNYTVEYSNNTNAGTATVTVTGLKTYMGTKTGTFTIEKAAITPSVAIEGWTYGETPKEPVVTGNTGNGAVTITYKTSSATEYTTEKPTAAGYYVVKATIAATANYNGAEVTANFTIAKAGINPSVTLEGWIYGEQAKTPEVSGNTGNGQVTFAYKAEGATEFAETVPTAAGTHTVKATIAASANYNGAEATNTFIIAKAGINPSVTLEGWTYGEQAKTPEVSGNTGNGQVTFSYKAADATEFTTNVPTAAGTHTVKATIAATANYNGAEVTNTFTIAKAGINPSVTLEGWTYGETAKTPVVTGNTGNGQVTFSYKASGATEFTTNVPAAAGTHTVKATIAASANYNGAEATNTFTIAKAGITPSVTLEGWIYGETAKTPVVTGNTGNGQVIFSYKAEGATEFTETVPTAAGTHTVKATIAATANYDGAEATANFTIAKATPVIKFAEENVRMSINVENEGDKKQNAVSLYLNDELLQGNFNIQMVSSNQKVVVIEDNTWLKPVGVGDATITVTAPIDDPNLEPAQATFNVSVFKTYDLTVADIAVTSDNRTDILGDGGSVQFDGQKLLKLNQAKLTGAISTTMEELTIFLTGENSITATTAAIIGNKTKLTFTTEGNTPGKILLTTTEATTVVEGLSAVLFNQNLAILSGAINEQSMEIGTPVKPIVGESGETNTVDVGGSAGEDLNNTVIENVLYTLGEDDYGTDETDNSLLLTNTMVDEDMQYVIDNYAPGTPEFAEHFSGLTFMLPAGTGKVLITAKTGEDGVLNVKIGSQAPYVITGILELTEIAIPYACTQATYVYIYNASSVAAESNDHRAGKKTTVTVGLASVGVNALGTQPSNTSGDNIEGEQIILSDADVEYDAENATLTAINSEVNSIYDESFVTFPFLKYIDLRNTNITGIKVSREEGAFKGVSKNTFIYVPAGNTTDEANVIIGNICESVVLDGNMEEDEAFGLSDNFVAGSIEYDRIFKKDEVSTIYLPFDIANEDRAEFGTFYTVEKMENGKVKVMEATNDIKAHTPYIFKAATDNTQLYNFNVSEIGMPDEAETRGAAENTPELVGCYETFCVETENDVFRLATEEGNAKFVRMNIDEEVKPFHAYLIADTTFDELTVTDKDITGINQLYDNNNNKMDSYYNLAGQRVVMPTEKGVYVRNGRKTVIR